jgi:peptide deformylase
MFSRTLTSTEPHGTGASSELLQRLGISIQPPKEK